MNYQQKLKERHEDYYLLLLLLEIEKREQKKREKRKGHKIVHYLYDGGELEVQRSLQDAVLGGSNQYQSPLALTQCAHRPVLLRHLKNTDPTKLLSTAQAPEKHRPHKTGEHCSGT